MKPMQKMSIIIPRDKYYNKVILYLGEIEKFHFIEVDKSKFDFQPYDQKTMSDIDNIITRTQRLIEKFEFRKLSKLKLKKEKEKFSTETEALEHFIKNSDRLLGSIEQNVSNFEMNEANIENDIYSLSVEGTDQVMIEIVLEKKKVFLAELMKAFKEYQKEVQEIFNKFIFLKKYIWAFEKTGGNEVISIINGWVPKNLVKRINKDINKITEEKSVIKVENPQKGELPPTLIERASIWKPFEAITSQYGTPNYYELDPTKLVAFIFPMLFGLMFGDIGQGIVIMIVGLVLDRKLHRSITKIFFWCGLASFGGGFLYGEFFGFSFQELGWYPSLPPILSLFPYVLTFLPVYDATGHSLMETNFLLLIKFSLLIGTLQLLLGYSLQFINNYKKKSYSEMLGVSFPTILFILFFMYSFFNFGLTFQEYLFPSFLTMGLPPIVFILIPIFMLLFSKLILTRFKYFKNDHKDSVVSIFGESALNVWETGLGFISNISSYLRIFALIMSHWALNAVFRTIADQISLHLLGIPSGIIIGIGNGVIIAIESMLVLTQSLRLTFYEWFGKFYQGNGIRFNYFKLRNDIFILE
ncbi:MAG: hypothetical protein EAX96_00655 [Candidatus Lokiarchaeota archaeon]|nr:hypothetical protein [Candidatus Lokiarchaeota archaeon]